MTITDRRFAHRVAAGERPAFNDSSSLRLRITVFSRAAFVETVSDHSIERKCYFRFRIPAGGGIDNYIS